MLANAHQLTELENVKILNHIQNYFKELNRNNRDYEAIKQTDKSKTQEAYMSDIRLFFRTVKGKPEGTEIEYLTMEDIKITQDDFEEFIDIMCDMKNEDGSNKYVNKTINRKVTALKGLVKYLKKKKLLDGLDISYLQFIKGQKERKNHYGALEPDECVRMSDLAWETEREKGEIKRLLFLFAFKTGLRMGELLSLRWCNFIVINDNVTVKGVGKNNKEFEIKIPYDLYKELLTINQGQENVFRISKGSVEDAFNRIKKLMGIQKERQIVFHSIRKAFGTLIWRMTGDIEAARRALRHENIATTQIYLGADNYEIQNVVHMVDKIEDSLYKIVGKDELIEAISNCPKNIQLIINMKLSELRNKNR